MVTYDFTVQDILEECNLIKRTDYNDLQEIRTVYYKCKNRDLVLKLIHYYTAEDRNIGHLDLGDGDSFILKFVINYSYNEETFSVYTIR